MRIERDAVVSGLWSYPIDVTRFGGEYEVELGRQGVILSVFDHEGREARFSCPTDALRIGARARIIVEIDE